MRNILLRVSSLFLVAGLVVSLIPSQVDAAVEKGYLIDNAVFDNRGAMSEANIQNFINAFPNSCLHPQNRPSGISPVTFKEPLSYYDYSANDVPASRIIWKASQLYGINPQVILATLEKEQNLVSGNAGCPLWKYNSSMGYNCPDGSENNLKNYPNIGVYNTCVAKEANATFSRQVNHASWQLMFDRQRAEGNVMWSEPSEPNPSANHNTVYVGRMTAGFRKTSIYDTGRQYDGWTSIDGTAVYLQNGATASLYNYTPHFNNFATIFTNWFGSTYAYVHGGISYASVFDPAYYLNANADVRNVVGGSQVGAFDHFIRYGMSEGRQAKEDFNVNSYRNRYADLRWVFGKSLTHYYHHFISNGKNEGRIATGNVAMAPVTSYAGIDYSPVYNYNAYLENNSDMQRLFTGDDTGALKHFVNHGINEKRIASPNFSVESYLNRYVDLRRSFGGNLKSYFMHFITNGRTEGRIATGTYYGGSPVLNGVDYSAVYDFHTYLSINSDVRSLYGIDDIRVLQHFISYGMSEGRASSPQFNVNLYKQRNPDLQQAFGNNLKSYYLHYMMYGKKEGRIAS